MGMSREVYIGAYLELTVKPRSVKETVYQCPLHTHVAYKVRNLHGKFCSLCGKEYQEVVREKTIIPSYWNLVGDEYEDELFVVNGEDEEGSTILLTGNHNNTNTYIDLEYGDAEITTQMIGSCQTNFLKKYKEIIEFLEPKVEKLRVKFGVIIYYG